MDIRRAARDDLPAVEVLLGDAGLPLVGAAGAFRTGIVAWHADLIVGAAAIEPFGPAGLLRSVVVRPGHRCGGVGRALVAATELLARELDIGELFLLTETAEDWFSGLGYAKVERSALPSSILASDEVAVACAETAVAMRRSV